MKIHEEISAILRNRRERGESNKEIAEKAGLNPSYISKILNPKTGLLKIIKMELETFMKLFPYARIDFGDGETADGDRSVRNCQLNHSQVVTGDGAVANAAPAGESARDLLDRLMSSPDLDAETKVKIYALATRRG